MNTALKRALKIAAFAGVLSLAAFSLTACGKSETSHAERGNSDSTHKFGKTLVVYYSATGNTKKVAQVIAQNTGADVMELTPSNPYSEADLDYRNKDSRVSREHDDPSLRDVELVKSKPDNWDSYQTVFIGYPIWWGIAAWPVDTFVKSNDFSGKTVIPFCTSYSSDLGDSVTDLQKMAGTGNWKEGMRFGEKAAESEISEWLSSF